MNTDSNTAARVGEDMDMAYEYWFACIPHLSARKKIMLRHEYTDAEQIYYIEETRLYFTEYLSSKEAEAVAASRKSWDVKKKYKELHTKGIRLIPYFHREYPQRLKEIADPPYALYVKGRLPDEERPAAAVVGARRCSVYGEEQTRRFTESLAAAGVEIISGMALGVDGAAQRAALTAGGNTYAVLGCGADICYPREHIGLYMDIQGRGGILSEYPPQTRPLKGYFPLRNRIISALSDIVLIMEAREKSGSLITADIALEQGKDIYALPGPVTSSLSYGCNNLIRQGAGILLSPEELLSDVGIAPSHFSQKSDKNEKMLESPENMVYSCLGLCPKSVSRLAEETKLAPKELMERLVTLELEGYIREISKNYYVKIDG